MAARALERYADCGENTAAAFALCELMAALTDTNLLHRGGEAGLTFVQDAAKSVLALPASERLEALARLDHEMIKRNLSPGGAADMLALGLYLRAVGALREE